jgi:hypothetical protein
MARHFECGFEFAEIFDYWTVGKLVFCGVCDAADIKEEA